MLGNNDNEGDNIDWYDRRLSTYDPMSVGRAHVNKLCIVSLAYLKKVLQRRKYIKNLV